MRNVVLVIFSICLALGGAITSVRAELKFQSSNEAMCRPGTPVTQTPLRWRSTCTNDCFVWRLTCSNGKSYEVQSKIHPATTELQNAFYEWAPWSFVLYMLPFLLYAGLAIVGSEAAAPLTALTSYS